MKSDTFAFQNLYVLFKYREEKLIRETNDWFQAEDLIKMRGKYPPVYVKFSDASARTSKMIPGADIIDIDLETEMKEKYPEYFL